MLGIYLRILVISLYVLHIHLDGERTLKNGKYFKIIFNYLPSMTATVTNAQHAPQSPCNFTRVTKFSSR